MAFRNYQSLRLFNLVARCESFTEAARRLNMTKGAISYQMARLEEELGFDLCLRRHRGISLTEKGRRLWRSARGHFQDLEGEIARLRKEESAQITLGLSTYFASRWLSPRLMTFTSAHPGTILRLQPMVNLMDPTAEGVDLAIRWGKGDWSDLESERLFRCPAIATAGREVARRIEAGRIAMGGIEKVWAEMTLLHDREGSTAWADWHEAAGLSYRRAQDSLIIPDPNVRVQAVIDGQGLALNDALVTAELERGLLFPVGEVALADYGYFLVYPKGVLADEALKAFRDWIVAEAAKGVTG
jgi:DNA-binding transcriptional LysR family regulator